MWRLVLAWKLPEPRFQLTKGKKDQQYTYQQENWFLQSCFSHGLLTAATEVCSEMWRTALDLSWGGVLTPHHLASCLRPWLC